MHARAPFALRAVVRALCAVAPLALVGCPDLEPLDEVDGDVDGDGVVDEPGDPETPLTADIDVDTNRDGVIDGADDAREELFDATAGAVFFANVDDDDGDGDRDRNDAVLAETTGDVDDLTVVRLRGIKELDGHTVTLEMEPPPARERVRVWSPTEAAHEVLFEPTDPVANVELAHPGDDVDLLIEALTPRVVEWDGFLRLTVKVKDTAGTIISEDTVEMRVSPVIFPDNLQQPRTLYVMELPNGGDNNQALIASMTAAMPADVELYRLNDDTYGGDRWVQDNMELGYQMKPGVDGVVEMKTALQLERGGYGGGLEGFVPYELLGASQGFLYPGGEPTSHNYGGNLEVAPPLEGFPFGRMIYGGGTEGALLGRGNNDTMNANQVGFLDAQEIQGPALQLSSEWLAVGHVDEIFQFVPDLTPDEGGKAFKVVIASPAMARETLLAAQSRGNGSLVVFTGRDAEYSVDEILSAENFLALNEAAQVRIDSVQQKMMAELGLVEDDFRPVPVMFEDAAGGLVAAFNPGVQNLITVGDRLFAPDPEGPIEDGQDLWREATLASLADTDLDVIFVDVFFSYHRLMGEAHCGTNVDREPYATAWWTE